MKARNGVILAALLCILVVVQVSFADAKPIEFPRLVSISGRVTDECGGYGIYGATLKLYDEQNRLLDTVYTDSNGYYSGLKGYGLAFLVKCSKAGYVTESEEVPQAGTYTINFIMDDPEKIAFIVYDEPAPGYDPIAAWWNGDTSDGFLSGTYVDEHLVPLLYSKGFDLVQTFPDYSSAYYLYNHFRSVAGHCDWVMLFISGHGTYENGVSKIDVGNFYMTSAIISEYDNPDSSFYIPSAHFFLFVDGCYSGAFQTVLADKPTATVVTSCDENTQGTMEGGSWGTRGSFTHDFFFYPELNIGFPDIYIPPRSIYYGNTIHDAWSYIRYCTFVGILALPQYSDSNPSDDSLWFNW